MPNGIPRYNQRYAAHLAATARGGYKKLINKYIHKEPQKLSIGKWHILQLPNHHSYVKIATLGLL